MSKGIIIRPDSNKFILSISKVPLRLQNSNSINSILTACRSTLLINSTRPYLVQVASNDICINGLYTYRHCFKGKYVVCSYTMFGVGLSLSEAILNLRRMIKRRVVDKVLTNDYELSTITEYDNNVIIYDRYLELDKSFLEKSIEDSSI